MSVRSLIDKARLAQERYNHEASQKRYDLAAKAVAWALLNPEHNRFLSEQAVNDTGLGKIDDKITKNHRKTLGLLRDIDKVKTHGIIAEDKALGLTYIARPIGVIAAVVPSTNPLATPTHMIVNALKCGNATIVSPSPRGAQVTQRLIALMHSEMDKLKLPRDLVQLTPMPPNKETTQELLELADLAIVTGSQNNVKRAYSSGTPALGVGSGNVSVIVDESASIRGSAEKITASKCFDNATSCSSENAVIAVDAIYDELVEEFSHCGGILLTGEQALIVKQKLRKGGQINRQFLAQDIESVCSEIGIDVPENCRFFLVPEELQAISVDNPLCLEKMSLFATLFRVRDFGLACDVADKLLSIQGAGHSIGLHSDRDERAIYLGEHLRTCRVIFNQGHCFATGGSFDNGMKFSLSMGCGSWGGNSIDDNLHYRHFMNIVKVVRPIVGLVPERDDLLSDYFAEIGYGGG